MAFLRQIFFKNIYTFRILSVHLSKNISFGLSEVEEILMSLIIIKGKISEFYDTPSKGGQSSFLTLFKSWGKDLGMAIDENTWLNICERIHFYLQVTKSRKLILSLSSNSVSLL